MWIRADCVYRGLGVRVELDGALAHPRGRTDADTWRDNAVVLERGEVTLRYRWRTWRRRAAAPPHRSAQHSARRLGGRARPCSPGCAVQSPS